MPDSPYPLARRAVMRMKAYLPPLEGRRSKIRLDFNENTLGFPDQLPDMDPTHVSAYPEYAELIEGLAAHLLLPPEWLLITNGSDEGLFVAAFTFIEPDEDKAIISSPTFSLIPHYLQLCQAQIEEVVVNDDLSLNLEGLEDALERGAKLALWASPDNPTGGTVPIDRLKDWLKRFPKTLFVLDEAYFEYHQHSALALLPDFPNLVVSRTFSKAWGMAGLRLGYLAAHPQLIEWMRRVRSPYSVNSVAAKTLLAFLPQARRVLEQADAVVERKVRSLERVKELGYRTTAGAANFYLIWAGLTSKQLAAHLNAHGVLVRDRSSLLKMGGSVRVSVGSEPEMEQFHEGLASFGKSYGIIFDLDDTLVDTSQSYDLCISQMTGASREALLALRAEGGFNDDWEAAAELLRRDGRERPLADVTREGKALYLELAPAVETPMFAPETLAALGRRHPLFILTGRPRDEFQPLWNERLKDYFRSIVCKDDSPTDRTKPCPDGLLSLMQKHGLTGGVYIGNSVDDMQAAHAAGLLAIGVTTNQSEAALRAAGADHILSGVDQVLGLFLLKEVP